jgi:uncharacterized repeat protein (TIGR01451 family)
MATTHLPELLEPRASHGATLLMLRMRLFIVMLALAVAWVFAPAAQAGPLVLMGIDAEDGGVGGHGPISVYEGVVNSTLSGVTNGGSGILVIGSGKSATDNVTTFWNAIGSGTGQSVTHVNSPANISSQSLSGFAMIAIGSDEVNTPSGGLTNAENDALATRAGDIASFVNAGGGLLGFSSANLTTPYPYLGGLGAFTFGSVGESDITPTPQGSAVGITDALDVCCWHDSYLTFPAFLNVLATYPAAGDQAAAIGGSTIVVPTSDLAITKTDAPDPVALGSNLTYTLTVTNNGPDASTGSTVSDTLPAGVTFVSATPSQGSCSEAAGTVTCPLGPLAVGASATIDIVVTVNPTATCPLSDTATVSGTEPDPDSANNSATAETACAAEAELAITKSDAPDPVALGSNLTYTLTVTNNGPGASTGSTVSDTLPAGVAFVSATPSQGSCSETGGTVTCDMGTLASGASATVAIVVTVDPAAPCPPPIVNTATVSGIEADPDVTNNSATTETTCVPPPPQCAGEVATIVGTTGDDAIIGTPGPDVIQLLDGNDSVLGLGGNDLICGEDGDDEIFGGAGRDRLIGDNDDDSLFGGRDRDELDGSNGADELDGGRGDDTLAGGSGRDELVGGSDDDELSGNSGADDLFASAGDDMVFGGPGTDDLNGGTGDDQLSGENGDDDISGNMGDDMLFGGFGDDELFGSGGDDQLSGETGDDELAGGSGNDSLDGGDDVDDCDGGFGTDADVGAAPCEVVISIP